MTTLEKKMENMQGNLATLRQIFHMTPTSLAAKLGVTEQVITALETGETALSRLQYLALCRVIDEEVAEMKDDFASAKAKVWVNILVAHGPDEVIITKNISEVWVK